jgi:DNA (cytosine-5)-methyltransferase 1
LENVRSLVTHDGGNTWKVITGALDELGYCWSARILDAKRLVPQHRERVFIVGFREEIDWSWPEIPDARPSIRDILETEVHDRYTLSDNLWAYLREYAQRHRERGNGFGYGLADLDGVSRTLSARYYKDGSEILIPQSGKNPRRLTPRECARLMGFPDSFRIPVSDAQAYRQFGNSVAVPLVSILAAKMAEVVVRIKSSESYVQHDLLLTD